MTNEVALQALSSYFELMTMSGAAAIFRVASEAGLLEAVAEGPKSIDDLALRCGLSREPCRLMIECLRSMDLLETQGDQVTAAPVMSFLRGRYANLGQEYWNHLPTYLRTAAPLARMDRPEEAEREYLLQVESLDWMMKPSAFAMVSAFGVGASRKGLKVLDLGAGSGVWSLQMLQADKSGSATLVDFPKVLEVARGKASQSGVADRVTLLAGNYHEVEFPAETFDVAILGNVAHLETEASLQSLVNRTRMALKPSGQIAIIDVFPVQAQGKLSAALYTMGLALRTENGRVHSQSQLTKLLTENGFQGVAFQPIPVPPYTMGVVFGARG